MTIELLNIDCMEYMASLPDHAFDLAIVDPPYGIGTHCIKNKNNRTKLAVAKDYKMYKNGRDDRPANEYFDELRRVAKNQIIWGANHLADLFDAAGSGWIVWNKEATGPFSACELAYSSFKSSARLYTYRWNGMLQGNHGDKKKNEHRIHPSQKPVALYRWLLETFADPGQKILDTHLGSGSSAIATYYFGCDFVGCEIDSDYHRAALDRFDRETRQTEMSFIGT
ncbi:MAG: site-specific DNA-methyltransferase [Candidatus Thiodiazotropha sp. (ex Epidulcina cf. delphinae)]|nr:site-specific DNA-methyltransferase [Candidatus Thiodiazotropha sp. (ex Epidulcina cf. delphinae)]